MIMRTAEIFNLEPERLAADTGYGSTAMLAWLVHERGIEPHIPVFDTSRRIDGTFSRADFRYDPDGDVYFCPANKMMVIKRTIVNDDQIIYRASTYDCGPCPLKTQCCPDATH